MKRLLPLLLLIVSWPAFGACPTGSTCQTFQAFSGVIKLVATGNDAIDTANFKAALVNCGPNVSISFVGTMLIDSPGLGDPPAGCEITGFDTDPYEGGTGAPGASQLLANGTGWPTGSAVIGSNDGVTYQHFTINGNFGNAGNCANVHNVQGFTALYVHVYQCLVGWNVFSDGNDVSHSHNFSKDVQIWNSVNARNSVAGVQTNAVNGGSNTDVQTINNTYSQSGINSASGCANTSPVGNVAVLSGTTGFTQIGSRSENVTCAGNRSWVIANASRVTVFGVQSDMTAATSLYINGGSDIAIVGSEETNSANGSTQTGAGPFVQLAGTIDRLISFGNNFDEYGGGCVYTAAGSTVTNTALYEQPYGSGAFCDGATLTILTPFFVSNDRIFP